MTVSGGHGIPCIHVVWPQVGGARPGRAEVGPGSVQCVAFLQYLNLDIYIYDTKNCMTEYLQEQYWELKCVRVAFFNMEYIYVIPITAVLMCLYK